MKQQDLTGPIFGVWFGVAGVAIGLAIYGSETQASITLPLIFTVLIGMVTTLLIFALPYLAAMKLEQDKNKRQPADRLALLMELLDEDERAAFKEALQARALDDMRLGGDGELPADEQTLSELLRGSR